MLVTTRSAARALAEKEKQATKRKPKDPPRSLGSKILAKRSNNNLTGLVPGGFFVEWLTLKDLDATSETNENEWIDILREMR